MLTPLCLPACLQIVAACEAAGVTVAQLHGDAARMSLAGLPARLNAIYVMTASPAGALQTPLPSALIEPKPDLMKGAQGWRKAVDWVSFGRRTVDWLLVDGQTPGSGEAYDWRALRVPRGASRRGWLLAGGLSPENVGAAIAVARPDGVDVASGVTQACGVLKDPARVEAFVAAVRAAAAAPPLPR
jgi:phosphoribosylanthranilate isomerase